VATTVHVLLIDERHYETVTEKDIDEAEEYAKEQYPTNHSDIVKALDMLQNLNVDMQIEKYSF